MSDIPTLEKNLADVKLEDLTKEDEGALRKAKVTAQPVQEEPKIVELLEQDQGSLSHIPKEVLDMIFKCTDFNTIQLLRKVSKPIRHFIDDTSTEINLTYLALGASVSTRNMYMMHPNFKRGVTFRRHCHAETNALGCFMEVYKHLRDPVMEKEITMENVDFSEMARSDLRELLSHQKQVLPHVEFNIQNEVYILRSDVYKNYLKTFKEDILKGCKGKLRVELVEFVVMNSEQVVDLLEVVDPESLRVLKIRAYRMGIEGEMMSLTEMVKLPHWKTAEELEVEDFTFNNPIKELAQFRVAKFAREVITGKEVKVLRDAYLQSPNFVSCEIQFFNFRDVGNFIDNFGFPNVDGIRGANMIRTWRFGLVMQPDDIQISIHLDAKLRFRRVPRDDIEKVIIVEREKLQPL